MILSYLFAIIAALCLVPSLYYGALQDLKEFKFSASHFESLWVNAAFVLVVLMYVFLVIEGSWGIAVQWFVVSVIAALVFSFIGFRYGGKNISAGGGGDWMAMTYIALIAPFMLIYVMLAAGVCGIIQAGYWLMKEDDLDTPVMFRKIPFALSILCGYILALMFMMSNIPS